MTMRKNEANGLCIKFHVEPNNCDTWRKQNEISLHENEMTVYENEVK